jgi:hypothetical protein
VGSGRWEVAREWGADLGSAGVPVGAVLEGQEYHVPCTGSR